MTKRCSHLRLSHALVLLTLHFLAEPLSAGLITTAAFSSVRAGAQLAGFLLRNHRSLAYLALAYETRRAYRQLVDPQRSTSESTAQLPPDATLKTLQDIRAQLQDLRDGQQFLATSLEQLQHDLVSVVKAEALRSRLHSLHLATLMHTSALRTHFDDLLALGTHLTHSASNPEAALGDFLTNVEGPWDVRAHVAALSDLIGTEKTGLLMEAKQGALASLHEGATLEQAYDILEHEFAAVWLAQIQGLHIIAEARDLTSRFSLLQPSSALNRDFLERQASVLRQQLSTFEAVTRSLFLDYRDRFEVDADALQLRTAVHQRATLLLRNAREQLGDRPSDTHPDALPFDPTNLVEVTFVSEPRRARILLYSKLSDGRQHRLGVMNGTLITHLPPGVPVTLVVSPPRYSGYVPSELVLTPVGKSMRVRVPLKPAPISGFVDVMFTAPSRDRELEP